MTTLPFELGNRDIYIRKRRICTPPTVEWRLFAETTIITLNFHEQSPDSRRKVSRCTRRRITGSPSSRWISRFSKYATFLSRYPYNTVTSLRSSVTRMPIRNGIDRYEKPNLHTRNFRALLSRNRDVVSLYLILFEKKNADWDSHTALSRRGNCDCLNSLINSHQLAERAVSNEK